MRAKCVRVLPQIRRAQDSPTEERSNRVSRPTVRPPGVSPRETSFGHTMKGRMEGEKVELKGGGTRRRCKPVRGARLGLNSRIRRSPIRGKLRVISQHVIK